MAQHKPALVKSASRTLDVIEFIVKSPKPPTFTAIQEKLDIPKSSLSYLLQDLLNRDYIQLDPDMRVYYPGMKLIQISVSCINSTNISQEIWLGIKNLSEELGETTHAAVLDGRHVVYIAKCQGAKDVSVVSSIGFRIPAHATAVGKVLLAAAGPEEALRRLIEAELERYTENTIVSPQELLSQLKSVAEQGYAIDNQEIIPGGVCIAAPVYDRNHKCIAAISVTMPVIRAGDSSQVIARVRWAAESISMRLGKV